MSSSTNAWDCQAHKVVCSRCIGFCAGSLSAGNARMQAASTGESSRPAESSAAPAATGQLSSSKDGRSYHPPTPV